MKLAKLHHRRRAVAMVEAVLAMIVVSLMTVAALRAVTAARAGQADAEYRIQGAHLAAELMTEIVSKAYIDPGASPVFGPESGEQNAARRDVFNDVDDFHRWTESPPQDRDGTSRTYLAGWERTVEVRWVDPADVNQESLVDRGVKKITVTVSRKGTPISRMTALRTQAVAR